MKSSKVKLGSKWVGDGEPVYIIAEGGLTNWGELKLAKKQVDASMAAGADCVKFQAQTTEELVSRKVDPYWFKRLKYKELSHGELKKLWDYASVRNIDCFITAHTDVDLDFLDKELNVPFLKVGSGESMNERFLKNVGSRKKPVVVSLGLHLNNAEVKKTISTLEKAGAQGIVILHCNTVYPTPPAANHLRRISELKKLFPEYPIGYSDHTVGNHMVHAAIALGATVIEKHLSFDVTDKRSFDCPGSCTPDTLQDLVKEVREIEAALKDPGKKRIEVVINARKWAQQSVVAKADIPKGTRLTASMFSFKRPGVGLGPEETTKLLGKTTKRKITADELILKKDVR